MKIIIPAYQPDMRLIDLIHEIQANSDFDIILVNDGSGPEYTEIFNKAAEAGCTVLDHAVNRGKGAALKTAYTHLFEIGCSEGFINADCDGQHSWSDIRKLAEIIPANPSSIILGCRQFIGKVPFKSMFGNTLTRAIFTLISGNKINDTQTGLRGFSSSMLPWLLQLKGSRYEYEMNQLLEAKKAGYNFLSVPINTIYENNNKGSHFHPVRDSIRVYLPIFKFSISSLTCGILDFIMLFLIKSLTGNLLFSVVAARVISSVCNYLMNKNLVFKDKSGKRLQSLLQYYLLAVCILILNYLLISFFNETIGLPLFLSKLLTEGCLFGLSYLIQNKFIFKRNSSRNENHPNT